MLTKYDKIVLVVHKLLLNVIEYFINIGFRFLFKSPEDMTMDEMKQQLALDQRLYSSKSKEDEQVMRKKRDASIRHNQKKKVKEYAEANKQYQ